MEATISRKLNPVPIGFAIFSMFFGAGNSIFPLMIGSVSGAYNFYAILGMMISTILVPFLGLYAMSLFKGEYTTFFNRLGRLPGFLMISLIMIIIGPFAGIPRCITLSYSTLKPHMGELSLFAFSFIACLIVFVKSAKKTKLIDILGKVLTPILLACLTFIIVKGLIAPTNMAQSSGIGSKAGIFFQGMTKGFQMMDLLASFFFSATVLTSIGLTRKEEGLNDEKQNAFFKAILLAAGLLGLVYVGFSYVAANNSAYFQTIPQDSLLGAVSHLILGHHIGFVMGLAVALACLTTAITLVSVFADFLYKECFNQKLPYILCIVVTVGIAFAFSNLGFIGICKLIEPILLVCYPALITLTVLNILYKLYDFKPIKWPVYAVLLVSLITHFAL